MNVADRMLREMKLMTSITDWMVSHGEVLSDLSRSNPYTFVRIRRIRWRDRIYETIDVDNLTCRIERIK